MIRKLTVSNYRCIDNDMAMLAGGTGEPDVLVGIGLLTPARLED